MPAKLTFIEQEWTRQPRHLVKVDPRNPLGQFAAVCIPGIGVFGTANPVAEFKVNTSVSINKTGAIWYQSGTSANAGVSLGSSSGLDLGVSSGVIECIDWSTASNQMALFRTGTGVTKNGDFYIDLLNHKVRLIKANVALIIESSNSVSPNDVVRIAWSYNGATGRTSLAVNGVLTTGISAQTFDHSGNAVVCGYDELTPTGTYPSNVSLFAISPKECFDNASLIRLSLNPWQIFEPEQLPLFKSSALTYTLVASGGSYVISGGTASISKSKFLSGSGGSYSLAGSIATIKRSKFLSAQGGTYTYQGTSVTITHGTVSTAYTLTCLGGNYAIAGAAAQILKSKKLFTTGGSYIVDGQMATLLRSKRIVAVGGAYMVAGSNTQILRSKNLVAQGGVYTLSGQQAILTRNRLLVASSGLYVIGGSSSTLTKSSIGGYPAEVDVRLGVVYGASGEYTGTLDIGKKFRLDIATGNVVMVLDGDKVMTL